MPTGQQYGSNAPPTALVGGINNSQLTGTVSSFTGWPAPPFSGALDIGTPSQELVDVTGVSGNSITAMTRGIDGSSAQAHSNNAPFTHVQIARDLRETRAHMDASASNDSLGFLVHGIQVGSSVVGTTDTQTLTNKTLTSPTITGLTASNPAITGTVTGAAQYQNITAGTTTAAGTPLIVNGASAQTGDILDVEANTVKVLAVIANGATGAGALVLTPTDTAHAALTINAPTGITVDAFDVQINSTTFFNVDKNGQTNLRPGPLSVGGITGAANLSRYVGATTGGPPTTGTFVAGDWVNDPVNGIFWTCVTGGTPGTWQASGEALLQTATLGSPGTVTFSSIPQYFSHLRIEYFGASTDSGGNSFSDVQLQFNGDTGSNYSYHFVTMVNSVTVQGIINSAITAPHCGFVGNGNANPIGNTPSGMGIVEIPYYSTANLTKNYVFRAHAVGNAAGSTFQHGHGGGSWGANKAAITSVFLQPSNAPQTFTAGTVIKLYGIG